MFKFKSHLLQLLNYQIETMRGTSGSTNHNESYLSRPLQLISSIEMNPSHPIKIRPLKILHLTIPVKRDEKEKIKNKEREREYKLVTN